VSIVLNTCRSAGRASNRSTDRQIRVVPEQIADQQIAVPRHRLILKTLCEMWIICLDPVSANSEKGRLSEWAVRVGQRLPSRFVQSGTAQETNLVQIVVEAPAIRGG